ncbi:DinB family protein [Candidatus Pristimantibacillus sp. PTI5]|uniref:DinB family protein n=1 Tax=Candidatus Pristimantibacillus sp. PTI5 TaxID=3400422 RepID=UPI003B01FE80
MFKTNIMKQFNMTRETLLKSIRDISETDADVMPNGFNNTIRWNIGHILTSADRSFVIAKLTAKLPPHYKPLFLTGTTPKNWTIEAPSLQELLSQLEEQKQAMQEIFSDRLDEKLETPLKLSLYEGYELDSIGEVLNFFVFHEAMHLGYINALKRTIQGN